MPETPTLFPTKPWSVVAASLRATMWNGEIGLGINQARILAPFEALTMTEVPSMMTAASNSPDSRALVWLGSSAISTISTSRPCFLRDLFPGPHRAPAHLRRVGGGKSPDGLPG